MVASTLLNRWFAMSHNRVTQDRGTVMLLFPASVIVILVLAAIVLDIGLVHVRVEELRAAAASAANDVLGAVDIDHLRDTGEIVFDLEVGKSLVADSIAAGPLPQATVDSVSISRDSANRWEIAVTVRMTIDYIIAPALPGNKSSLDAVVTERVLVVSE